MRIGKALSVDRRHFASVLSRHSAKTKLSIYLLMLSSLANESQAWHYDDTDAWGREYPDCKKEAQSPINIVTSDVTTGDYGPIKMFHYSGNQYFNMINNGHSLQLGFAKRGSYIMYGGLTNLFQALQFHFHWDTSSKISGSEHQINGKAFPLEMHIVHKNVNYSTIEEALDKSDGLAVLGFLFKLSKKANPEMDKFINIAKTIKEGTANVSVDLGKLIGLKDGSMANFYRYTGSLTTPPCSQAVIWSVFRQPINITLKQLKEIWKVRGRNNEDLHNFRPTQPMNGRTVCFTA